MARVQHKCVHINDVKLRVLLNVPIVVSVMKQ